MRLPWFAAVPPFVYGCWLFFFTILLLLVALLVSATTTKNKNRGKWSERNRRAGLGLAAIVSGPMIGASFAGLSVVLGNVHPLDVSFTFILFIGLGSIAGFATGTAFALTSIFSPRDGREKETSTKRLGSWDEL